MNITRNLIEMSKQEHEIIQSGLSLQISEESRLFKNKRNEKHKFSLSVLQYETLNRLKIEKIKEIFSLQDLFYY